MSHEETIIIIALLLTLAFIDDIDVLNTRLAYYITLALMLIGILVMSQESIGIGLLMIPIFVHTVRVNIK